MFSVLGHMTQPGAVVSHAVGVAQPHVEQKILQPGFEFRRTERPHHRRNARVTYLQHGGKSRRNGHCRWHSANGELALRAASHAVQILMQQLALVQHALCTGQHALTFWREAAKRAPPRDDRYTKFVLKRPQRIGQSRLGDVASRCRTAKVLVLIQRGQISER